MINTVLLSQFSLDDLCIHNKVFSAVKVKLLLILKHRLQHGNSLCLCHLLPIACKHFVYTKVLFKFPDFSQELSIEARGSPRLLLFLGEYEAVLEKK